MYLGAQNVITDPLADVRIPYCGEWAENGPAENQMFCVDLHAAADQPAGEHSTELQVCIDDDTEPYYTKSFTAAVWRFALPESHYSTMLTGLYNTASGYAGTGQDCFSPNRSCTRAEVLTMLCGAMAPAAGE